MFVLNSLNAQFSLSTYVNKDTCYYKVTNTGNDTFVAKRFSLLIFNQKSDLLIEPGNSTFGVEQFQYTGSFYGKSYRFNHKTIQQHPLYDTFYPGTALKVLKLVNTGSFTDTVLGAAITLSALKIGDLKPQKYPLYPEGTAPCGFTNLFLNSGGSNTGIGYESFSAIQEDLNECVGGVVVKCYDGNTGKQTGVANVIPMCSGGRLHTFYGAAKDSSLYHSFAFDSTNSAPGFDTLVNGMKQGDYLAVYTTGPFRLNTLSLRNSSLNKIGLGDPMLDTTYGLTVFVGRKGLAKNKGKMAWCQSSHLNCKTSVAYTLSLGNSNNEMYDYPECYETLFTKLTRFTNSGVRKTLTEKTAVFPNPSHTGWMLKHTQKPMVYNLQGQLIQTEIEQSGNQIKINATGLKPGIYLAVFGGQETVKLIRD